MEHLMLLLLLMIDIDVVDHIQSLTRTHARTHSCKQEEEEMT